MVLFLSNQTEHGVIPIDRNINMVLFLSNQTEHGVLPIDRNIN